MSRHKRPSAKAASPNRNTPTKPVSRPPRAEAATMPLLNRNAAGIDVHSDMHIVCVPADRVSPAEEASGLPAQVRRFGANSCDLRAIADWLKECGVLTVALESTGVYRVPLFELLESRGFEVWLVEPGQLSLCGARLAIEEPLRKALAGKPSHEAREQIELLLGEGKTPNRHAVRRGRALQVLEWIGNQSAKEAIAELAKRPQPVQLTQEAKAALQRLEKFPRP